MVPAGAKRSLNYKINHLTYRNYYAGMAELVDAPDLGSGFERSGGSSPPSRTTINSVRIGSLWSPTKGFPNPLNAEVIATRLTERAETFLLAGKGDRSSGPLS